MVQSHLSLQMLFFQYWCLRGTLRKHKATRSHQRNSLSSNFIPPFQNYPYSKSKPACVGRRILIVNQRLLLLQFDILWMIFCSTLLIKMLIHYKESLLYSVYIPCAFITCRYDLSTGFFIPDYRAGLPAFAMSLSLSSHLYPPYP